MAVVPSSLTYPEIKYVDSLTRELAIWTREAIKIDTVACVSFQFSCSRQVPPLYRFRLVQNKEGIEVIDETLRHQTFDFEVEFDLVKTAHAFKLPLEELREKMPVEGEDFSGEIEKIEAFLNAGPCLSSLLEVKAVALGKERTLSIWTQLWKIKGGFRKSS